MKRSLITFGFLILLIMLASSVAMPIAERTEEGILNYPKTRHQQAVGNEAI